MKKQFKPNAADFFFHKLSVAKQPKERFPSKVESEIRMRILGLEDWETHCRYTRTHPYIESKTELNLLTDKGIYPYDYIMNSWP